MNRIRIYLLVIFFGQAAFGQAQNFSGSLLSHTTLSTDYADLDGDGDLDFCSGGMRQLSWDENIGNNTFVNHVIANNQIEVQGVVIVDLDQDGYMDIVSASLANNMIYWNRNNGNNVFVPTVINNAAAGPAHVDVADMDGDGDLDVVVAAFTGDKFFWLKNNGSQTFTLTDISTTQDGAIRVKCADFDGDGDQDILCAAREAGKLFWLRNNGLGVFTNFAINNAFSMPRDIHVIDVDVDGDLDFLYCGGGGYGWYRNDNAVFTQFSLSAYSYMRGITGGFLNSDGLVDIALANYDLENITWISGIVNGTSGGGGYVNTWVDYASMVSIADFNADGYNDVLCAGSYDIKVAENSASTVFTERVVNKTLNDARGLAHGDFDNDGDIDLIGCGYLNLFWFRNEENGEFTPIRLEDAVTFGWITTTDAVYIRAADFDGDGDTDAVFSENDNNRVSWLENLGGGDFTQHTAYTITGPYSIDVLDFDLDGDMDVITSSTANDAVYWHENNGSMSFTQHLIDASYWDPFQAIGVDYDLDGDIDVLTSQAGASDKVMLFVNNNNGASFTTRTIDSAAPGANSVYAIDIDDDGDIDFLSSTSDDNKINLYKSNGAAYPIFTESAIATGVDFSTYVYADDYDNDGDIDVVCSSLTDRTIDVLINDGSENFSRLTLNNYVDDAQFVESGDLDGDGIPEIYGVGGDYGIVEIFKLTPYLPPPPVALTPCEELFISEYVEGSSYNKVIEIYNPTPNPVVMTNYKLEVYSNGATQPSQSANLSGTVAPYDVYVICNSLADLDFWFELDLEYGLNFNGDDAIALTKNGQIIDQIGVIGQDPGTAWTGAGGASTLDKVLVRKSSIAQGNNSISQSFDPSVEWDVYNVDNPFYIGFHDGICATACIASVDVSATETDICGGTSVTFTATYTEGGSNPQFQWKKNGNNVGTNSTTYTDAALADNDVIKCVMTTDASCALSASVESAGITMNVNPSGNPAIGIVATATTICSATSVTFTATATNGGTTPQYQWKKNGNNVGSNATTYVASGLVNGDVITCVLTSNAPCMGIATATSNAITMTVSGSVTPSVTISTTSTSICANTSLTFTAVPVNGGTAPSFQWKKNGNNVGTNSSTYTASSWVNGDIITCVLTSNAPCATVTTATSNSVTLSVSATVTPSVTLSSSTTTTCSNGLVVFTAFAQNGGTSPSYVWYQNGQIVSTNGNGYSSSSWTNGTQVYVTMTSNAACPTQATVTSNTITLTVNPTVTPTCSISTPNNTICSGTNATFTASITNGGTSPSYQWKKNGSNVGTNSATYSSSTLVNGDIITCVLTSNVACATATTATSNTVTMTVNQSVTPTVAITASQTSLCGSGSITFTANAANQGASPIYQWKKNGGNVGTNSSTYTSSTWANGDIITCQLTGSATCGISTVNSNAITISVSPIVTPTVVISTPNTTVCSGSSTTFTASITNGGSTPSYIWLVNGNTMSTASASYSSSTLMQDDVVQCIMTSSATCVSQASVQSNAITINVNASVTPTCSIAVSTNSVCAGTSVSFLATISNGGLTPTYQWKKNGNNVGTNGPTYTSSVLNDGDIITCTLLSSAVCAAQSSVLSNAVTMDILPLVIPTISIDADQLDICENGTITFTAQASNAGSTPSYQWKRNGENVGVNSTEYIANDWTDGDVVTCTLTGSALCGSTTAESNVMTVNVLAMVTPTVTITTSDLSICSGTTVSISANGLNGGTTPIYTWMINGDIQSEAGLNFTTSSLMDGDVITCEITSNAGCVSQPTALSDELVFSVTPSVTPAISIFTETTTICDGSEVIITSEISNGGSAPEYMWFLNNTPTGWNGSVFTYSGLQEGDEVNCMLMSNALCASVDQVTSEVLSFELIQLETPVAVFADGELSCTSVVGATYQWYLLNEPVDGAISNVFQPTANGLYHVVINYQGCEAVSNQVMVNVDGVGEMVRNDVSVYPNPTNGLITIMTESTVLRVKLYNSLGQCVLDSKSRQIDLSGWSNGLYHLEVMTEVGIVDLKVIKTN